MPAAGSMVQRFRERQRAKGLRHVELRIPAEDVDLLRRVAAALRDPSRRAALRDEIGRAVDDEKRSSLKELLLEGSSFDDLDLTRSRDAGCALDLCRASWSTRT